MKNELDEYKRKCESFSV